MFKPSFSSHSIDQLAQLNKRRKVLNFIGLTGHVAIIVIYTLLVVDGHFDRDHSYAVTVNSTNTLLVAILTVVSLLAMQFIHRNQRQLQQFGIHAN